MRFQSNLRRVEVNTQEICLLKSLKPRKWNYKYLPREFNQNVSFVKWQPSVP